LAFRLYYYGQWTPNTLSAKTGNLEHQLASGLTYVGNYAHHAGIILWFGLLGLIIAIAQKQRALLAFAAIALAFSAYIILIGGDWMPLFRFISPVEPFLFILVDAGLRAILDRKELAINITLAILIAVVAWQRMDTLGNDQQFIIEKEKRFWDSAAGGTAQWF